MRLFGSFQNGTDEQSFFNFMQGVIAHLRQMGKIRTAENYSCTLKSFMQFRQDRDILLSEIDSDLMQLYEAYLHGERCRTEYQFILYAYSEGGI